MVDELPCSDLRVVRSNNGTVTITTLDDETQKTVRRSPEAFLSSGLIVCEGSTEIGLCKALDNWWMEAGHYDPLAVKGISLVDGNGVTSERYVERMASIGYSTAFFGDSDRTLNPSQSALEAAGATVIIWAESLSLEERLTKDLPWTGVQDLLALAVSLLTEDRIRAGVCGKFPSDKTALKGAITSWPNSTELRTAIGLAAKDGDWFKRADIGEQVGGIVATYLPTISTTDLAVKVSALRAWIDSHE